MKEGRKRDPSKTLGASSLFPCLPEPCPTRTPPVSLCVYLCEPLPASVPVPGVRTTTGVGVDWYEGVGEVGWG